jgi:phosphonopyruvate decarboxylase
MMLAGNFIATARKLGFDFFAGVPCSYLTSLINRVSSDPSLAYVGATSEGEAIGIGAGAWLAGRLPIVMCQNSGLGNTVNPLTSLNHAFHIPTLLMVTWRGQPGHPDEPQHEVMGEIMHRLLETIRVPYEAFPQSPDELFACMSRAKDYMDQSRLPFAMVTPKGSFADEELEEAETSIDAHAYVRDLTRSGSRPTRVAIIESVLHTVPGTAAIIATTGKCGRELFTVADREQHLYLVGSMGCASAVGLGVALNVPNRVIVLDGDGAALMKMGNLATVGAYAPENYIHILLDNGVHDSTGGQRTVSTYVDFAAVAAACSYRTAAQCDDVPGFETALKDALNSKGPHFIRAHIRAGSLQKLGRPTVGPVEVAERFRAFIGTKQPAVVHAVAV